MSHNARLENRTKQGNGSISYDLIVKDNETGEEVINTDFTVEPRQEERDDFDRMVERTAQKLINSKKGESGKDHSGKSFNL